MTNELDNVMIMGNFRFSENFYDSLKKKWSGAPRKKSFTQWLEKRFRDEHFPERLKDGSAVVWKTGSVPVDDWERKQLEYQTIALVFRPLDALNLLSGYRMALKERDLTEDAYSFYMWFDAIDFGTLFSVYHAIPLKSYMPWKLSFDAEMTKTLENVAKKLGFLKKSALDIEKVIKTFRK